MNQETSTSYADLLHRLDLVRAKELRLKVFYGTLASLLISLLVVLFAVILEELFSFDTIVRTILFSGSTMAIAAAITWFIVRPLLSQKENHYSLARRVGSAFPDIRDRLLDAMEIYEQRDGSKERYSIPLIDASFSDLYENIQPLDFVKTVSNVRVKRMGKIVSFAVVLFILLFVVSPFGFYGSFYRIVKFQEVFAATIPIQFEVEPGNVDVVRGQNVPVTIRTRGKELRKLSFLSRQHAQIGFDEIVLSPSIPGEFHTELNNVKTGVTYYASAEDIQSPMFTINVIDRPLIKSLQVRVVPPIYTRLPVKMLDENIGDISAYPGSKVRLEVTSSKDLSSAEIVFSDSTIFRLSPTGSSATGGFTVKKNIKYHVVLKDMNNLSNINPVEFAVKVVPDEYPTVEILSPGRNIDLTQEMKIDLFMRLKDDFGFSKLRLAFRLAQSKYEQPREEFIFTEVPIPPAVQNSGDVTFHWDLGALHLVPEDAVAYYAEVLDNDNISGPKSGKSETYMIRLPSLEEVLSDVSQSQEHSMESMQSMAKEAQQLKKDVEELQREMKKNREKMDWQQQQKAEQMLQKYEAMKKNLEQTAQKMEEMVKKMEENKLLSDKTLDKYQELQKLMDELKSPELQEALKKLQQSMKQPTPEQMKQAMDQLKATEEQYRKNLERIIDLLKRIHIEQKLDELIKRTEELNKQQESLKQEAAKANPGDQQKRDEAAMKQDDLKKQMEALEKETSELKKKMEEFPKEMPLQEMEKTEQQIKEKKTGEKMQKASSQMKSGSMQQAKENQEKSEQDLTELQKQLEDVRKQLQENQQKQIVNEMKRQLQNIIELSKEEEELKNESKSLDPNSQRFRENGEKQNSVRSDLDNVANAMNDLGKKTFAVSPEMGKEMGNAMKQMDDALQQTEGRNPNGTSQKQGEAMSSLNRAAMMMQGALSGMQGGQGGMGMAGLMGRLGQMAGQQGGINAGTQEAMGMGGQGQGQGMSSQQQAEYQRLSGQQAALQKSLDELSKEAKNAGEFSKLLGDLDQVAKQMQEVQTDLVQGNVNPETIQKQDKILSRLLDASRSTRERDYEKRRRSEAGKLIQKTSPNQIDLTTQEGRNRLREEMLKVREGKYSKDYEELIRKYFEQLEKVEQ